jgi:hypothetical protein
VKLKPTEEVKTTLNSSPPSAATTLKSVSNVEKNESSTTKQSGQNNSSVHSPPLDKNSIIQNSKTHPEVPKSSSTSHSVSSNSNKRSSSIHSDVNGVWAKESLPALKSSPPEK